MKQAEYVEAQLKELQAELESLPGLYEETKAQYGNKITLLLTNAGIADQVRLLEEAIEGAKVKIQNRADVLQGQLKVLRDIHYKFLLAPIPQGVTHMYGIELEPLDPETRLKVMHGQDSPGWLETISTLGGDPNAPSPRVRKKK